MSAIDTFDGDSIRSRLLAYLRGQVGGDVEVGPLKRYTVGFSWLTFGFNAKWNEGGARIERDLILRLGPPSGIFAPYRATPEFLTLQSLAGSSVPVPHPYWCCDDSEALGAPFFVCEFVKGDAAWQRPDVSAPVTSDLGFIANATEGNADKGPAHGPGNRLAERRLADTGGADKRQDHAATSPTSSSCRTWR